MAFSVATYNVLASAYAHRGWYPRTPAVVLTPEWRIPALAHRISAFKADLFCLQEVEPAVVGRLKAELAQVGYHVHYARNGAGRPDGLAIFYREKIFTSVSATHLVFTDGGGVAPDSGYIALIALLQVENRLLGVMNTHLQWDPPDHLPEDRRGYRQAREVVNEYKKRESAAAGWIVAGDLNDTPDSALAAMIRETGLDYAHRELGAAATCNVNGQARMIDYLFHSAALRSEPEAPPPIDHSTILPSAEEPSDHVALIARFAWKD
jgi:mRNA deadenylase 3'-5' endonuclease subunit Ccr4